MYCHKGKVAFPVQEKWKDIQGQAGYYQVSNYGTVQSVTRTVEWVTKCGKSGYKNVEMRYLKPKIDKDGYEEFCLCLEGERTYRRGHRLVGEAFVDNPDNLPVIDHIDNSKRYNLFINLRWVTNTENTINYYKDFYQEGKNLSSLTKEDWQEVLDLHLQNISYKDIATQMGLSIKRVDTIGDGLSSRRFSSITGFTKDMRNPVSITCLKLTDDQVIKLIHDRVIEKLPLKTLSLKYGVSESMVSRMANGKKRPEVYKKFKEKYYE